MSGLETIEQVAARFAPESPAAAAPADGTAAGAQPDAGSGKGGTASDPAVADLQPQTAVAEAPQADEAAPVEPVEPKPAEPKKDPLSVKFGALARKERELRAQEANFKRQMDEFNAKQAAAAATPVDASIPKNPMEALKKYGFKYSDATEMVLGNYKEPEVDPLDARLKPISDKLSAVEKLEAKLAQLEAAAAAKEQSQAYEAAMSQIDEAIGSGSYEFVQALGEQARDLVRDTIVEYYNVNQKMLDYSEACDIVEKWYDENVVAPILNTAKVKSRLAPPQKPTPTQPSAPKKPERTTLTNSLNAGGQATIDIDKLPKDQALAELAKRLKYID